MSYQRYMIKRLLQLIPTAFGLITILFLLTRAMPGDPVRIALGPTATKEQIENLRHIWGYDRPIHIQYIIYIRDILTGNWGKSLVTFRYVKDDLARLLPATMELALMGMTLAVTIGLLMGIFAANYKDKWPDHISRIVSLAGVSLPRFWTGIIIQIVFGYFLSLFPLQGRIALSIMPPKRITGFYLLDSLVTFNWQAFFSSFYHLILPAITLSFGLLANISRLTRSSMIDETMKDYVIQAKANGLPETLIVYVYMFKNAFIPSLSIIALAFARSLGGSILVETVFNWPGVGSYLIGAVKFTDVNGIVGASIIVGFSILIINLITDFLYAYIDPRIRYGEVIVR